MFDITKKIDKLKLDESNLTIIDDADLQIQSNLDGKVYDLLLERLATVLNQANYRQGSRKTVLRLAIDSIGSFAWGDFDKNQHKLFLFIKALKEGQ